MRSSWSKIYSKRDSNFWLASTLEKKYIFSSSEER